MKEMLMLSAAAALLRLWMLL